MDNEISVFDIHNIFRRCWFLSRAILLTNVISAQKDEDGNISWVEFSPQYHSHLVKCAARTSTSPSKKVKKVMFVYILELLNGKGNLAFFDLHTGGRKANNAQKEKRCLARKRAVLLSEKGNVRPRKWPNSQLVSGNAWHVGESSSHVKLPASTSAPIPKWSVWEGKRPAGRPHKPHLWQSWTSPLP